MDEFALIREYFAKALVHGDVALGIGDDCALLIPPNGEQLAVSLDTLVEGVHFPHGSAPELIATRAFTTALSDLAAMGAKPLWVTMGLTLPSATESWVSAFCSSFLDITRQYQCALVGGDITRGPLTISVQVHGSVEPSKALKRSGAKAGDHLYVTGCLGDGAAGLAVLEGRLELNTQEKCYLEERFFCPKPCVTQGLKLADVASSAIDISDGLYADLGHICKASAVGAVLEVDRLPINTQWSNAVPSEQALAWALGGGDDYQLCFTVPPEHLGLVDGWIDRGELNATAIGQIIEGRGVTLKKSGKVINKETFINNNGYRHF